MLSENQMVILEMLSRGDDTAAGMRANMHSLEALERYGYIVRVVTRLTPPRDIIWRITPLGRNTITGRS